MKAFVIFAYLLFPFGASAASTFPQEAEAPTTTITTTQEPASTPLSLFPDGYRDHDALSEALKELADENPDVLQVRSLTETFEGRDVWLATLGRAVQGPEGSAGPAILIVANLEADHLVGSEVAYELIRHWVEIQEDEELQDWLDANTLYVVPRLNPDGAERLLGEPRQAIRTNLRPVDDDRDGEFDEDGPADLNGDGLILRMRVKDDKATLVPDEKDDRILRKADRAKGERPVYSEYDEGQDVDNDGQINEDPPGGVNLNRNWPHNWTEYNNQTGFSATSEPEVRALIQFCYDHPEIAIIWTFTLQDNLRATPKKPETKINDTDLPIFSEIANRYQEILASSSKPSSNQDGKDKDKDKDDDDDEDKEKADESKKKNGQSTFPKNTSALGATTDGAMSEWAYHQFGVLALSASLWPGPTLPDPEKGEAKPPADGEARWLYWNDQIMDGKAFVPFEDFEHPDSDLGTVEIGGWKPGVRINPPSEKIAAIVEDQMTFLKDLAGRLATLEVVDVKVEPKGGGLYAIEASVENSGYLPTALSQGVRTRQADPVLVRLQAEDVKILAGKPLERIDSLNGSGGRRTFRWLIHAEKDVDSLTIKVTTPKAGEVIETIRLQDD